MKIVILQKPGRFTAREFNSNLESALRTLKGELSASIKFDGVTSRGWAQMDITGEDSEIMSQLVTREFGEAQVDLTELEHQGVYEGRVANEAADGVEIDIGIEIPRPLNVRIGVEALRAQLADGKPLHVNSLVRDYCLFPGNKASVRITRTEPVGGAIDGWLADSHLERLSSWIAVNLDRIQIPDCFRKEAESAAKKSGVERDVVAIEPITLTTQSLACKLGTDAVGLIPKLGSVLKMRQLNPFIPRRIVTRCRPW